jgi:hypothetical protein
MPTLASIKDSQSPRLCGHCLSRELRRQPRTLADKILSLQRYKCGRCSRRETKLRGGPAAVLAFVLYLALIGAVVWLVVRPAGNPFRGRAPEASGEADALARARAATGGQLSSFDQLMMKKPTASLDNATILRLWRAHVGTSVILQMIKTSIADFDLGANSIIELRQAGVDESIILAMIDANGRVR